MASLDRIGLCADIFRVSHTHTHTLTNTLTLSHSHTLSHTHTHTRTVRYTLTGLFLMRHLFLFIIEWYCEAA